MKEDKFLNKKFNKLTVLEYDKSRKYHVIARCDCGKEVSVSTNSLIRKKCTKSCGCFKLTRQLHIHTEMIGKKYGRLTVLSLVKRGKAPAYLCECNCGNIKEINRKALIKGMTKSCGCLKTEKKLDSKDFQVNRIIANYRWGAKKRSLLFNLSRDEVKRIIFNNCNYCGRSPENEVSSKSGHTKMSYNGIDRIDSSKGYEEHNCVACCSICNTAKSDLPIDEFKELITNIYRNFIDDKFKS